ncbi:unnamed protein product [Brassica napus]|uniref:(rape) hypothetical protein n=1 Tax=Brassica napus TaxID=3708 RepID=A0A816J535_BRANA|nr:unnamed protein product [Brassica napus]
MVVDGNFLPITHISSLLLQSVLGTLFSNDFLVCS